eukprot:7333061-Prymnesium_polylepis.1
MGRRGGAGTRIGHAQHHERHEESGREQPQERKAPQQEEVTDVRTDADAERQLGKVLEEEEEHVTREHRLRPRAANRALRVLLARARQSGLRRGLRSSRPT